MKRSSRLAVLAAAAIAVALVIIAPLSGQKAASTANTSVVKRAVPNVDINMLSSPLRAASSAQLAALNQFKSAYGSQAAVRWNAFAGSPDVMMGFHTAPLAGTPEQAARA